MDDPVLRVGAPFAPVPLPPELQAAPTDRSRSASRATSRGWSRFPS
jgi:hypothetical protein